MPTPEMPPTPPIFEHDVFLSHSSQDRDIVRDLANRLRNDGLRVWFDEGVIEPGDMIQKRIEEALQSSRTLILAMSAHAYKSEWVALENATFRFRDPTNTEQRFIPLRLDNAEVPWNLQQYSWIDWRDRSASEYARLVSACRPRVVPETPTLLERRLEFIRSIAGHRGTIYGVDVSDNGRTAITCSLDEDLRVWNLVDGTCRDILSGHTGAVFSVDMTPDARIAVSGSEDETIRVWNLETGKCRKPIEEHDGKVMSVAIDDFAERIVSGSEEGVVIVAQANDGQLVYGVGAHDGAVLNLRFFPDGKRFLSAGEDQEIILWDTQKGTILRRFIGHSAAVNAVAISSGGDLIISGSDDRTVRVWNVNTGKCLSKLEGHTGPVFAVSLAEGTDIAASGASDQIRIWNIRSGECLTMSKRHHAAVFGLALHRETKQLLSVGQAPSHIVQLQLNLRAEDVEAAEESEKYTNAKVLLVGDSGVGKSALAIRLAYNRFEPATVSSDAVWATQLQLPQPEVQGIEREIWLWDFAGQADYRLIHQLYMDETALAVLVFNPQSENPFEGLGYWDKDLQLAARRPFKKLLVAGRCDRGGLMVSRDTIDRFSTNRGFVGYVETSARQGTGCDTLRNKIIDSIAWDEIPWTASPRIFRLLKDEILRLRDEGRVLLRTGELKQQLEMRLPEELFTLDELRAVVGLLAGPGIVWQLEFGDFVLLQPERINSYAAAVIRKVRAHTDEIGCIEEGNVLEGNLDYQDMPRLVRPEEEIVLRAMHQTFVDHGLCLREHTEEGTLLIFPSYFRRERPDIEAHPLILITYQFDGPLDEIYATLVVRLHHTPAFEKDRLWRFAADFLTPAGRKLGLKMKKMHEGAAELEIYFEPGISNDLQVTFIRYVHEHLMLKANNVRRVRHYICPHCHTPIENRQAMEKRLREGKNDILCGACEQRVELVDLIEEKFASKEFLHRVKVMEELAKAAIDTESRELVLVGHTYAITGEAGQIYRQYTNSDHGIDGEIEFKDDEGQASGMRLYLQLKSGDSYLYKRKADGCEIFSARKPRWISYWRQQAYPVMLVIRSSDGTIRWMNVTEYLRRRAKNKKAKNQIVFQGEPFTALTVQRMRDKYIRSRLAA